MSLAIKANNALTTVVDFYATALEESRSREVQLAEMAKPNQQQVQLAHRVVALATELVSRIRETPGIGFTMQDELVAELARSLDRYRG